METIGVKNEDIFSLTPDNLYEKVIWFTPEENSSNFLNELLKILIFMLILLI